MLKVFCRRACSGVMLLVAACSPGQQTPVAPVSVEAVYRLLFNDVLVGNSLFVLQIDPDGSYRIEAFTTPSGEMQQADGHEVLESSQGTVRPDGVQPQRFEKSIMSGDQLQMYRQLFDWEKKRLRREAQQGAQTGPLLPGTQDRLSYLLAARQLAIAGEGTQQIQIVAAESTDQTALRVAGREAIRIPLGQYETTAIHRATSQADEIRALWFDPELSPLPLRVVHGWAGNTVDMQLESLSRR